MAQHTVLASETNIAENNSIGKVASVFTEEIWHRFGLPRRVYGSSSEYRV